MPRTAHLLAVVLAASIYLVGTSAPTPALASDDAGGPDKVVLADGREIEGEIVGENEAMVSIRSGGVLRAYPRSRIASLTRGERPAAGSDAEQDAAGDDGKAAKKDAVDARRKRSRRAESAELSAAGAAWLDELVAHLRGPGAADDPSVRRSVAAALVALGSAAAEPLHKHAANADGDVRTFLEEVAGKIERGARKRDTGTSDAARGGSRVLHRLREEIELSDEQAPDVARILGDLMRTQRETLVAARRAGLAREEVAVQLREAREDAMSRMGAVLDAQQMARFREIATELLGKRGAKGGKKAKKKKQTDDATQQ